MKDLEISARADIMINFEENGNYLLCFQPNFNLADSGAVLPEMRLTVESPLKAISRSSLVEFKRISSSTDSLDLIREQASRRRKKDCLIQ